jgi:hypothetical protein
MKSSDVNRKGDSLGVIFGPICDGRGAPPLEHTSLAPIHLARSNVSQWCALTDFSPKHDFLYCVRCPSFRGNC